MKSSSELFQLIKSLNKSEKRYFKLHSSLHGSDKKYIRLFEAIEKQKEYDERRIIKIFENEKFIRQLPVIKNYLYGLILKKLESYHSCIDSDLYSYLHHIKILFEKGLYVSCERIMAKAISLAEKYERFPIMLELQEWKMKLIRVQSYLQKSRKEIDKIFQDSYSIIRKYQNITEFSNFSSQLYMNYFEKGLTRDRKDLESYKFIINVPAFDDEKNALSFHAKLFYYNSHGLFSLVQQDYRNLYIFTLKYKKLFEENPHYIIEEPRAYINSLHNLIFCQSNLTKYDEMFRTIQEMRRFSEKYKIKSDALKCYITFSANTYELEAYINKGNFDKGINLIKEAGKVMNDVFWRNLNKRDELSWLFLTARSYLSSGEYLSANIYLNKILNKSIEGIRDDIQCFARILSLIVHFEMKKYDLLEYTVKSTCLFLNKRKRLYQVETIVLDFIKKQLPRINSQKELIKAFTRLRKNIEEIIKDPFEKKALEYFDFISWLESKIENRPFAEIIREKAGSRK